MVTGVKRVLVAALAGAGVVVAGAGLVRAEALDLGAMTCGEAAALDGETLSGVLVWMDGFTGGLMGDSTFDAARLAADVEAARAACAENPDRSLLDAMKAALGG